MIVAKQAINKLVPFIRHFGPLAIKACRQASACAQTSEADRAISCGSGAENGPGARNGGIDGYRHRSAEE